jgi:hypothetical protein
MQPRRILVAFAAGFLAVLVFHQGGLALLNALGLTDRAPYALDPTKPLGVPQVISSAFWGGLWGIALAYAFRTKLTYSRGFTFGAIAPTLVALLVVMPLKGQPVGGGWDPQIIVGAMILNGLWGLGTVVFLKLLKAR